MAKCELTGSEQCAPPIQTVKQNKIYRLRIASTTALASLNVAIAGHPMIAVEADGNYVRPFETNDLDIYSGESYSVLIRTVNKPGNYWISVSQIARDSNTSRALTILNYNSTPISKPPTLHPPPSPKWNDFEHSKAFIKQIEARMGTPKPPTKYDRQIILLNTQNVYKGFTKWAINNVSLVLPPTPYLGSRRYGLEDAFDQAKPPENFPKDYDVMKPPLYNETNIGSGVYKLDYKSTVDVILQNANMLNKDNSEIHPWHLHGHDFWVLGHGEGKFTKDDVNKFNLVNPPLRNTVLVFPHGWTALRFVADNPGVWAFHCHIEPHLHMGMGVVFAEGVDLVNGIPMEAIACGLIYRKFMDFNKH